MLRVKVICDFFFISYLLIFIWECFEDILIYTTSIFFSEITDSRKQEVDSFTHQKHTKCLHVPNIFLATDDTGGLSSSSLCTYISRREKKKQRKEGARY